MTRQDRDRPASRREQFRQVRTVQEFAQCLTIEECRAIIEMARVGARLITIVVLGILCVGMSYFISDLMTSPAMDRWTSVATLSALAGAMITTFGLYCACQAFVITRDWLHMIDLGFTCYFVRGLIVRSAVNCRVRQALLEVCRRRIREDDAGQR
ncbi:hypothetical protein WT25_20230 [Burkholderia territorii]|uniref:hypothetical protein n=1 Tax=Burkholderia territorii TaxID=1503055 RepID=UPI00076CDF81|nr:hypothetical protein [Burkholderia territorii]KVT78864.1 hypothetical protein WT25_20230 [Burkholderia territorii]